MFEKIKKYLNIVDNTKDDYIRFILDIVTNKVLMYCNIEDIPKQLENVVILICIDVYRKTQLGVEQMEAEEKSISQGDTTIQYKTASEVANTNDIFDEYKGILRTFRQLR